MLWLHFADRTGSCSTFDSLDLTRISDDGQQVDDRVAGDAKLFLLFIRFPLIFFF